MSTLSHKVPRSALLSTTLALCVALVGCSREAAIDLRPAFDQLKAGQSLEEVRRTLQQPLATPASQWEALGFQYAEYRLVDARSDYALQFMSAPFTEPHLVSKSSRAHLP